MKMQLFPSSLSGTVAAIPSKSDAHRLLICASLADRPSRITLPILSQDLEATCRCLHALGAGFTRDGDDWIVSPIESVPKDPFLDCGESGSTFRFLLPVAAALTDRSHFVGSGRLPARPIEALKHTLEQHGMRFSAEHLPFTMEGTLESGEFLIPGNISSQYITGLLLAATRLPGRTVIRRTTALESAAYIDITCQALQRFHLFVAPIEDGWEIPAHHSLRAPGSIRVEGDWSNAAFFLVSGAINHPIQVTGLDMNSPQGDKYVLDLLQQFGAAVRMTAQGIQVSPGRLKGTTVDIREIPDALPALAVLAACSEGTTHFTHGARLRLKESDRLSTVMEMIRSLGGTAWLDGDCLHVEGSSLQGGTVDGAGDHRIVMASAIAAAVCRQPVILLGAEAANKSYGHFFEDYQSLGGIAHVI